MTASARDHFRYQPEWDGLRDALQRLIVDKDGQPISVTDLVEALVLRDDRLEDFLNGRLLDGNVETVTTDAAGRVAIAHLLPFTPRGVLATSGGPDAGGVILATVIVDVGTIDDTQFVARLLDNTGAAIVSTAGLTFAWVALR